MTLNVDVFWSFRSPYSYLATPRLKEIQESYDVAITVRPVYPIAVRIDDFFKNTNQKFAPHVLMDSKRVADRLGMDFVWPNPDPIVQNPATREISKDQPYIYRLTRLGQAASEAGQGVNFIYEVSHLIFGGTPDWDKGNHLAAAAERAGLNLDELEATITSDQDRIDAAIEENHAALDASYHWGVPTMLFDGETFFGQDRIETLLWRMEQKGLSRRH